MLAALGGCASDRLQVRPVALQDVKRICVIENPRVREEFLDLYRQALVARGYQVDVVPSVSPLGVCPVTSKYVAYWSWDVLPYMARAQIDVYRDGLPAGQGTIAGKYSATEEKIRKLVHDLYR
jgi:hypothetical protein